MIRKNKWQLILSSVIILLPVVAGLLIWNDLPQQIATHWDIYGEPNRWSSRRFAVLEMPLIFLAVHWACILFTVRDPKNKNQNSKVFSMVLWFLPIISLIACGFTYAAALGYGVDNVMIPRNFLGILFVIAGNYLPKCKQNHTIGIKVTWALRNEENSNKTHRFAGRLWVICGLLLLATIFVPMEKYITVFFPLILFMALAPIVYSYVYYRKQLKSGTAAKV